MILKDVLEGGCLRSGPFCLFVILDAVLCALKCIFVLIDNLLWHISTTFSFDMTTLLQPDTSSLLYCVGHIVFIYFHFSSVQPFFFLFFRLPLRHISKYITVLINKFIFKVRLGLNVVDLWTHPDSGTNSCSFIKTRWIKHFVLVSV